MNSYERNYYRQHIYKPYYKKPDYVKLGLFLIIVGLFALLFIRAVGMPGAY